VERLKVVDKNQENERNRWRKRVWKRQEKEKLLGKNR